MLARLNDLVEAKPFTETDVEKLEAAFLEQEQADCPVQHHFGPGVYIREVVLPNDSHCLK